MNSIKLLLEKIEEEFSEVEAGSLTPDMNIKDSLNWNSMNALTVMALIAVEFNVKITADQLSKCNTFEDLYNIISNK
jgi:acyl carrier protein